MGIAAFLFVAVAGGIDRLRGDSREALAGRSSLSAGRSVERVKGIEPSS
jgi:hypothetical protein